LLQEVLTIPIEDRYGNFGKRIQLQSINLFKRTQSFRSPARQITKGLSNQASMQTRLSKKKRQGRLYLLN